MSWIGLSLLAAVLLGAYDLCKKHAVAGNAVLPVLFFSNLTSAAVWAVFFLFRTRLPEELQVSRFEPQTHLLLSGKAVLVGTSWIFAYFAVKHLPVSIAGPIRSTAPLFTIAGAVALLGEAPTGLQWAGIAVTLVSFLLFSLAGRKEGIRFASNRWVFFIIAATVLGGASSLYDRYLLGIAGLSPATVQAGFSFYLVGFFTPFAIGWYRSWWPRSPFTWRWSIPAVGIGLLATDFLYFTALSHPDALVSVVSSIRRASLLVVFFGGAILFRETNLRAKLLPTLGILAGVLLLVAG